MDNCIVTNKGGLWGLKQLEMQLPDQFCFYSRVENENVDVFKNGFL